MDPFPRVVFVVAWLTFVAPLRVLYLGYYSSYRHLLVTFHFIFPTECLTVFPYESGDFYNMPRLSLILPRFCHGDFAHDLIVSPLFFSVQF